MERLWRTDKYECVFLHEWTSPREANKGQAEYFRFYNNVRPHKALDKVPPAAVYYGRPNKHRPGRGGGFTPILFRSVSRSRN